MITPKYLQQGDKVAIVAPAGKISEEKVEAAASVLRANGLVPEPGSFIYKNHFQFSSTDKNRLKDLQNAMDNPEIKAILCARGGYGLVRILDQIDFKAFKSNPKWVIGFSDVTALHAHIQKNLEVESIHGVMTQGIIEDKEPSKWLFNTLFGKQLNYKIKNHPLSRKGNCKGEIIGGNLAILNSLAGSKSDFDSRDKILFLEEVGEHLYRIDRMMQSLKRAGKLSGIKGLIVGSITDVPDNKGIFGLGAYEIISEAVKEFDFPVCFGFPAGHQEQNFPLILGRKAILDINDQTKLTFETPS